MIRLKMKNYNIILTKKQQKYQHYHLIKLMNMNLKDRKILIKVEIYLFFLGKVLRKKKKIIKIKEENKKAAIKNQNKRQEALTNKDNKNLFHQELFEKLVEKEIMK